MSYCLVDGTISLEWFVIRQQQRNTIRASVLWMLLIDGKLFASGNPETSSEAPDGREVRPPESADGLSWQNWTGKKGLDLSGATAQSLLSSIVEGHKVRWSGLIISQTSSFIYSSGIVHFTNKLASLAKGLKKIWLKCFAFVNNHWWKIEH